MMRTITSMVRPLNGSPHMNDVVYLWRYRALTATQHYVPCKCYEHSCGKECSFCAFNGSASGSINLWYHPLSLSLEAPAGWTHACTEAHMDERTPRTSSFYTSERTTRWMDACPDVRTPGRTHAGTQDRKDTHRDAGMPRPSSFYTLDDTVTFQLNNLKIEKINKIWTIWKLKKISNCNFNVIENWGGGDQTVKNQ